ncbi:MAG: hypothetical protein ACTHN5_03525 [Phycisphaerae bacterium]
MVAQIEQTLHDTLSRANSALTLATEIQESLWRPTYPITNY